MRGTDGRGSPLGATTGKAALAIGILLITSLVPGAPLSEASHGACDIEITSASPSAGSTLIASSSYNFDISAEYSMGHSGKINFIVNEGPYGTPDETRDVGAGTWDVSFDHSERIGSTWEEAYAKVSLYRDGESVACDTDYVRYEVNRGTIRILSADPPPGSTLQAGDDVTIQLEVDYDLWSCCSGKATFIFNEGHYGSRDETKTISQRGDGDWVITHTEEVGYDWSQAVAGVRLWHDGDAIDSDQINYQVTGQTNPPTVTRKDPSSHDVTYRQGTDKTFKATVEDDDGLKEVRWYKDGSFAGSQSLSGTGPITVEHPFEFNDNGNYDIEVEVEDTAGLEDSTTWDVEVPNNSPTAKFRVTEESGLHVCVDGSDSFDEDGSIAAYTWDYGDGGSGSGVTDCHDYDSDGSYQITLTVTDDDGAKDVVSTTIGLDQPEPPVACVTPEGNDRFRYSWSAGPSDRCPDGSYDPDTPDPFMEWEIEDRDTGAIVGTGSGDTFSHLFEETGPYVVRLIVHDDAGVFPADVSISTFEVSWRQALEPWTPDEEILPLGPTLVFDGQSAADDEHEQYFPSELPTRPDALLGAHEEYDLATSVQGEQDRVSNTGHLSYFKVVEYSRDDSDDSGAMTFGENPNLHDFAVVEYWYYYPFNPGGGTEEGRYGDERGANCFDFRLAFSNPHEHDFETIFLWLQKDGNGFDIFKVATSWHLWRDTTTEELAGMAFEPGFPVFVERGGHAMRLGNPAACEANPHLESSLDRVFSADGIAQTYDDEGQLRNDDGDLLHGNTWTWDAPGSPTCWFQGFNGFKYPGPDYETQYCYYERSDEENGVSPPWTQEAYHNPDRWGNPCAGCPK